MQNPIVPESALRVAQDQIRSCANEHRRSYHVDPNDPDYGPAFANYLFFSHDRSPSGALGIELDDEGRFYNAYYWFQRFARLYMDKHGCDAGVEQQAFKMLEGARFGLDFEIIEMLDKKATQ